jgi:hypothetical protein
VYRIRFIRAGVGPTILWFRTAVWWKRAFLILWVAATIGSAMWLRNLFISGFSASIALFAVSNVGYNSRGHRGDGDGPR